MSFLVFSIFSIIFYFLFFIIMTRIKIYIIIKYFLGMFLASNYLNIIEYGVNGFAIKRFGLEMTDSLYWFSLLMLIAYIVGMAHYLKKD